VAAAEVRLLDSRIVGLEGAAEVAPLLMEVAMDTPRMLWIAVCFGRDSFDVGPVFANEEACREHCRRLNSEDGVDLYGWVAESVEFIEEGLVEA
jgi:hypothetical protein